MWLYVITLGELISAAGEVVARGFSGNGDGLNNPAMCNVPDVGPVPVGWYTCLLFTDGEGNAVDHTTSSGEVMKAPVFRLVPDAATNVYGRSGLLVHGGTLSEGCIVIQHDGRILLKDGDRLQTVANLPVNSGIDEAEFGS